LGTLVSPLHLCLSLSFFSGRDFGQLLGTKVHWKLLRVGELVISSIFFLEDLEMRNTVARLYGHGRRRKRRRLANLEGTTSRVGEACCTNLRSSYKASGLKGVL
jgi:hypothetical protein